MQVTGGVDKNSLGGGMGEGECESLTIADLKENKRRGLKDGMCRQFKKFCAKEVTDRERKLFVCLLLCLGFVCLFV